MSEDLKGKSAVVTGAGRGIGAACAESLAAYGVRVVVNDPGVGRDGAGGTAAAADEVVEKIRKAGGTAIANYDSVSEWDSAKNIIDSCVKEFDSIDILVQPAGFLRDRMLHNMTEEDWDLVVNVHLKGHFNCIRHAAPYMREKGWGRIINFTSTGWLGSVGQCNYSASKGGIVSLTRSVARELGSKGVTCNAIAPGAATRMTMDPEVVAGMKKKYEAGKMSKEHYESYISILGPEYVAPVVTALCTEKAANINGKVLGAMGYDVQIFSEPVEAKIIYKGGDPWPAGDLAERLSNMIG